MHTNMLTRVYNVHQSIQLSKTMQLSVVCLLGSLVLLGVGFLPMDALHNAAHDTRHSFAFPCH